MDDIFNNPTLLDMGRKLFLKLLTDKEYQQKLLTDLENLDNKLKKIVEEKEKKEKEENKKIKDNNINKQNG